jgi:2-phospho-L-lactate/phosphoenolpyruvate guanylyltransferase
MSTLAVLPVKSFGAAKQRLAEALPGESRRALAQAMLSDVLGSLGRISSLDALVVVTADPEAGAAARSAGADVVADTEQAGQSPAAKLGIRYGQDRGFERVLLVPGDTPLLDPGEVDALLERAHAEQLGVVVMPDRHGEGTNALLLRPPDAIEPSFGPGSLERHVEAARTAGVAHSVEQVPTLMLDIDTGDDLSELVRALESSRGRALATQSALLARAVPA